MKKLLKVVGWGLVIWGLSLAWPSFATLTPRVADALAVGMVVALSAYFLGNQFTKLQTEHQEGKAATGQFVEPRYPTRPSTRASRASRVTRPIPQLAQPGSLWRATRPVWVTPGRIHNSRITRPIPEAR